MITQNVNNVFVQFRSLPPKSFSRTQNKFLAEVCRNSFSNAIEEIKIIEVIILVELQ